MSTSPDKLKSKTTRQSASRSARISGGRTKSGASTKHGVAVRNKEGKLAAYYTTLGVKVVNRAELVSQIRTGLDVEAFTHLAHAMALSEQQLAKAIDIPLRTLTRRKQTGKLQQHESDRLVRIASLFARALELFEGDRERATHWFQSDKKALGGASPIDYSDTDIGAQEVEDLIGRLEHGVFS